MSEYRLHVLMDPAEARDLRRYARRHKTTAGSSVRRAIRDALRREPKTEAEILATIRKASRYSFPAPGIERMNEEIERGCLGREWPR